MAALEVKLAAAAGVKGVGAMVAVEREEVMVVAVTVEVERVAEGGVVVMVVVVMVAATAAAVRVVAARAVARAAAVTVPPRRRLRSWAVPGWKRPVGRGRFPSPQTR